MIPLDEAQQHVLDRVAPLAPADVPLADALGCVLVDAVTSPEAVPPFANTAMDGYAVRAVDVESASEEAPTVLPVVAEVAAGHPAPRALETGEAMRIFTGAPIPDGADAVIMVELTDRLDGGERVAIRAAVPAGNHIRPAGDDIAIGGEALAPDERGLNPGALAVLASIGRTTARVHPRPRVGVLSTGDELVAGDAPLQPGQIRETNRLALCSLVRDAGWEAVDLGIVRDDEALITAAITDGATRCDALLTTGGVSMGDIDLVRVVLDRIADMRWMQIAIKPAKPFAFGVVRSGDRDVPVFGLPGNPVSSMVSFELLARPALRKLAGHAFGMRDLVLPRAASPMKRRPDGKAHFVRVRIDHEDDGDLLAEPAGGQGSHQLRAMAVADGLAILADGEGVDAGDRVPVIPLGPLSPFRSLVL